MIAVFVNACAVLLGGFAGMVCKSKIQERYTQTIFQALALVVVLIGVLNAIATKDVLCVILCISAGTLLGEWMDLQALLEKLGNTLKSKLGGAAGGKFTQGFVTASLLFCVGSMSIMGSLEAGINQNYDIIFSKSMIDGISAIMFGATLGIGVLFSALSILGYQGGLTLLAGLIAPYLSATLITEMSAIGGVLLIGMGLNMLNVTKMRLANMLPAILLPALYFFITGLL